MYNKIFNISYIKEENKVYIESNYKSNVTVTIYNWNTITDELVGIYTTNSKFDNNTFWYSTGVNLHSLNGIKVEIKTIDNNLIKEEYFRFRTRYNKLIKKQALLIQNDVGVGDNLTVTPVIRKMFQIYNQKITLFTYIPDAFINNPYVEKTIKIEKKHSTHTQNIPENYRNNSEYEIHKVWEIIANVRAADHRQISAWNLGFELSKDELQMNFFPDPYEDIVNLPKDFICINPSITNIERTWGIHNWQKLVNLLEKHIPIVAIGKTTHYDKNLPKTFSDLKITNGLNLLNHTSQDTLSQAYHIINKSKSFVTMNNGLYILALCDDNHITEISTPWDTENNFRIRKGIKDYNLNYVEGNCKLRCLSNLKTAIDIKGTTRILKSGICYLGKSSFECHPTPENVCDEILKVIKNK